MRGYTRFILIGLLILGLFCGSAMGAAPVLSEGGLSPPSGNVTTTFVFNVTFTDADNDTADYVKLVIDSTEYGMTELNSSDVNTTDGKKYTHSISGLTVSTYNYNFTASSNGTNADDLPGSTFTVTNSVPSLSGSVSPTSGNVATTFDFNVTFTDADNDTAYYVNVTIDGTDYTMAQLNTLDSNTSDGKDYTYAMSSFGIGDHNFNFATSDGMNVSSWTGSTFTVGNSAPTLNGSVSPPIGVVGTTFYFNLTFTDAENETATYTNVTINGTDYVMFEVDQLDDNTTDGKKYTFNKSDFSAGEYYYNFKASDGTNNVSTGTDTSFLVDVSNHPPEILSDEVSWYPDSTVSSIFYFNATYKDVDNNASAYMYAQIDGTNYTMLKVNPSDNNAIDGIDYSYNSTGLSVGDHSYYFLTSDGTFPVNTTNTTVTVNSKTYYTGDRIWDALTSPSLIYTWTAKSYSGFYYDLDSGQGSESMEITLTSGSRSVGSGKLKYSTEPINTNFERTAWGNYSIIGFMAERYFAGYPSGTFGLTSSIDLISSGQMSKVLINEEKSRSIYAGSALILEDGYTLNVIEVDKNGDKVFISLTKDGSELESTILSSGSDYIYSTDLGSADDVPIVVVHFDYIFQGQETSAVFVNGIFQISDKYITIKDDDSYDKMKIISTSGKIEMENSNSFTLNKGNTIDIMGKIKFLVADSSDIRFAPFVDMTDPGTYELRGTVAENEDYKWTPLNFEGFYYNMDDGKGTESLEVVTRTGTTIAADGLVYKAEPTPVSFEYGTWKTYDVVGFMAENYFAGYPSTTTFVDSTVSMISNGQLSKVLINEDKSRAIHSGAGLILDEGYVLNIIEVDKNGEKVAVSLSKDGSDIGDMSIVTAGNTYVYEKDLGSSDDVPIIAVHFDQIFQGPETNAVFIDGIFQISDQYITVKDGDTYGKMKVETVDSTKIEMRNENSISLTRGKSISIMGDILFKVADSGTVRYYPYVEVTTAPHDSLDISMPTSVKQGEHVSIIVTSRGATVSDVTVKFDDDNVGKTSVDGTLSYKPALSGTYTVTAEKEGYVSTSGQVEVISPLDETKKMSIEVSPDVVYEGNQLTISIIKSIGGEAIEGVDVSYDGKSLGTTPSDGTISYTVKEPGMHKLIATKTGNLDAELNLEVLALEAKFEFSNLVISPLEVKIGKDVTITLDASNTGKAEGEYNVDLMINGNLTESETVTLDVGNSTTIEFEISKDEPGTYLVEVNGLSGTFEVLEKTGSVALYVLGILGAFAAVAVGYMFTAGGWTVEMVTAKVAEFIESVR